MYLCEIIVVEGFWREFVCYRSKRLVGDVKIVSVVLVRLINAYKRVIRTQFWIKTIWYHSRELSSCYLSKLCGPKPVEAILLYLRKELAERIMSLENQASTIG